METLVLTATSILSFGTLPLQARARAFYVIFLHMLLMLTVGSLAYRTLSRDGTLLVPLVDGWSRSPLMQLTNFRAYSLLAVSLLITGSISLIKARIIGATPPVSPVGGSFSDSSYCCLMMLWIHLSAVLALVLL
ncbi:MAG: hypothetical protein LH609_01210 [Rudanella sp.]|nr:hypothetical protein [Rudanella sp.]